MFDIGFILLPLAYIDPGTGGIILQLIIAGLVGTAVFFRQAIGQFLGLFIRKKKTEKSNANADSSQ